jgi:hypothetical protein
VDPGGPCGGYVGVSAPPPVPHPPGQRVGVDPGAPCGGYVGVSAPPPHPHPPVQRVGVDPGAPCGGYVGVSAPPPPPPGQLLGGQASPVLCVQQLLSRPP